MAVEFGDHTSGFRHTEVIRFINNEVLMNGGGPEFYMTFRSRSWNEIEDQLHSILIDPKVPRSLKRAFTWSALALSVRVAARQSEQQARRVGRLQDQVGERETASWTLASELQRLREERDQAAAQLVSTQNALQEAMDEREVLRGRLLQAERSAMADVPEPRIQQCRAAVWPFGELQEEEMGSRGTQNTPNLEGQMPIPPVLSYLPGLPGPWVPAVHPFLRMPVPHPLPLNSQFPLGFPYATPVSCPVVMEPGATPATMAAVVPQMAPATIYPPNLWVAVASPEAMPSSWGQMCHRQNERSEVLQNVRHQGDSGIHGEEECSGKPKGTPLHGDNSNNNHKESRVISQVMGATERKSPVKDQVTVALEVSSTDSIKEESVMPHKIAPQENKTSCIQKKYPGIPRKVVGLRDSISHNTKEDSVTSQETATQVNKTSPILKKYPGILLRRPDLGSSLSCKQKEDLKTSQGTAPLEEDSRNCKKEGTITCQQVTPLATGGSSSEKNDQVMPQGTGKIQNQNEEPNRFQISPLGKNKSYCVNKFSPEQLPPKQKAKQPQGTKAFESKQSQGVNTFESKQLHQEEAKAFESKQSQGIKAFKFKQPQGVNTFESKQPQGPKSSETKQQEKPLLNRIPVNWVCPSCKAVNRSWCKGCYKCAKASVQLEKKDFDSKPTC
ncbi:testis-expressed sequence 13C protein [Sigmodon hispidus]